MTEVANFINYVIKTYQKKLHRYYGLAKVKTKTKTNTKTSIEFCCLAPKLAFESLFSEQDKPYKLIFTSATLPK